MQKTVLLTGVAGFIGSHLAEAYLAEGYSVVGLDNFSCGKRENMLGFEKHPQFIFHNGDVCDRALVNELMAKHTPQIINHQAAQKSVPASVEDPHFDAQVNSLGLLNLLMACKDYTVEQFIFASTGGALAAEPQGDAIPDETWAPQLLSPYAVTKYAGERYLSIYSALFGFAYTALRYSNVYGPRQVPAGECGVIPIFVENAVAGKPSVLFAYPDMPDGCTRDYVHVRDVVAANMLATKNPANCEVHISSGVELPIAYIYERLMAVLGKDVPLLREGPRLGDIRRSVISNARAKALLGWESTVGLEEGLLTLK
ncbi:MAG: NAD-dependent epimerase/dehydratase family protein [Defluviitaleaceae bacterium]|nr:NAD-dependent epimerase/dehydratase family protein [Defluviitaleaceae bacterium]